MSVNVAAWNALRNITADDARSGLFKKVFLTTALDGGGYLLVSHTGRVPSGDDFQRFPGSNLQDVVGREISQAPTRNWTTIFCSSSYNL